MMQDSAIYIAVAVLALTLIAYSLLSNASRPSLSKTETQRFPLINSTSISPNTAIYRFALKTKKSILGLPIGQHISIVTQVDGKLISRSYTPITNDTTLGYFDLLIKTYPLGVVSKMVQNLKIGESIMVKGPKGNFTYTPNFCSHLTMIAGGTGIDYLLGLTPMYQIIESILRNPLDTTKIRFIYANVTYEDILMKQELDAMVCDQFEIYYVLNSPGDNWKGGVGFVSQDMIKERGFEYKDDGRKVLVCGPIPMVKAVVLACEELGYPKANALNSLFNNQSEKNLSLELWNPSLSRNVNLIGDIQSYTNDT